MTTSQAIKGRRSIRKYKGDAIPHEVIEGIIEDASYAPSWMNTQISRYIFIENREVIDKIAHEMVLGSDWNGNIIENSPAIVVVTYLINRSGFERDGTYSTSKGNGFELFDVGIASQSFCLSAYDKGIGTLIMGYFDEEKIAKFLKLPETQKIGAIICMGYPDEAPTAPKRKAVADLVTYL